MTPWGFGTWAGDGRVVYGGEGGGKGGSIFTSGELVFKSDSVICGFRGGMVMRRL